MPKIDRENLDHLLLTAAQDDADEIARLRASLRDISEGRGMFGVSAAADLEWAIRHAGAAIDLREAD